VNDFHGWLGFTVDRALDGTSQLHLDYREEVTNNLGYIHGGIIATLVDAASGLAIRSHYPPARVKSMVTADLSLSYHSSARDQVTVFGHVLSADESIAVTEARVLDASGKLLATSLATYRVYLE
jgi:acyl-CoA thioesterase